MRKILIVDDDVSVTNYLMVFLMQHEVFEPVVINDSRDVPDLLETSSFDTIILDMDMPNLSGLDILKIIHERKIDTPVLVLSGVNDVDLAVKALKLGAFDFLSKPVDDEYLIKVIDRAIEHHSLQASISQMPEHQARNELLHEKAFELLVSQDPDVIQLFHKLEKIAAGDGCIFLKGERGTGRRFLAFASHNASSRNEGPFIDINVANHDAEGFAAELFGLAKGWAGAAEEQKGFIEQAHGGTLYLSNIDKLTQPVQHRLDRMIKSGEFYLEGTTEIRKANTRLIVSSTVDLSKDRYRDYFSRDLLYHLWSNLIVIPPLRDRAGDIRLFAEHFLKRVAKAAGKTITGIDPELIGFLESYEFPGNESELRDAIATAVLRENGETLKVESLSRYVQDKIHTGVSASSVFVLRKLDEVVRESVQETVRHLDGDIPRAALELDVSEGEVRGFVE